MLHNCRWKEAVICIQGDLRHTAISVIWADRTKVMAEMIVAKNFYQVLRNPVSEILDLLDCFFYIVCMHVCIKCMCVLADWQNSTRFALYFASQTEINVLQLAKTCISNCWTFPWHYLVQVFSVCFSEHACTCSLLLYI